MDFIPISTGVHCGVLTNPTNGQVSSNGTTFGETATYSCNTGYNLVGDSTRTCEAAGAWSGNAPTCECMLLLNNMPFKYVHNVFLLSTVVNCNALSDPANGQVSTTGTTFGETATYSCNTGYNLVGDNTRTCGATRNWSGSEPTCERMLLLNNSPIKYVNNIFLLSTAIDCSALSDPANGQVSTNGTTFGETATYSCNPGYNLVGDSTRTCGATGNWSGSEPTCERMLLLSNMPIKYVNNVFLLSTVVDCDTLSDPANGQVSTSGTTFGETATYSCNTGYNLVGDSTRTCQATGNWSGSEPTCERMLLLSNLPIKSVHNVFLLSTVVDCNALSDPANGQVSTSGTTFGETATYSCNPGYNLVGDNTRTCQATGNWSGSEPTCERMLLLSNMPIKSVHNVFLLSTVVDCDTLSDPANGQVSTSGTTFGQTATYSCNPGYNLVGDNTRACQATGNWSGSEPTCERMLLLSNMPIKYVHNVFLLSTVVDCNALSDPANGQVSTSGTTFGETATYSCNTGYNLVGDNTRTCQATGNWSGSEPTCERMLLLSNMPIKYVNNVFLLSTVVDCNALSDPANGQVSTSGTTFGETATYSCNPGYNLVGDNIRACQATGNWSGSEPTCERMLLLSNLPIKYVNNIFLLSTVVDCNALSNPANGQVSTTGTTFGETATYSCNPGYNLVGDNIRACQATGNWSGSEPTCERMLLLSNLPIKSVHNVFLLSTVVDCNALSDPTNGQVSTSGTTFGQTATYSCNTGYNLVGDNTRTCQATGNWSGSEPTCERMLLLSNMPIKSVHNVFLLSTVVDCNALSDPANGQVSTSGTTFGETATYSCNTGYNLVGNNIRTCQATGNWSGSEPTCERMLLLSNITIKYVHNVFLLSTAVDCDTLSDPANGQVSTSGTTFGETATYSCNTGYNLVGNNTRTCQATGNWSGSEPTCERMLLLSNITIKYVHNVFLLSTVVDCNALSNPANGQVSTSGTTFGETATYSCNPGYNLVGDNIRACQATGNWSGSEPTCERMLLLSNLPIKYVNNIFLLSTVVDCNALSNPTNGQVSTSGTTFGQTATYSCNTGYNLVGDNTRTCQATGNWSGSEPTCERMLLLSNLPIKYVNNVFLLSTVVDCNALSDPANGQVSTTGGTTFGQTATYSCNTGYNLVGDNTRTCGATGNWSGSAPTCERMLLLSNMPNKYVHNVFLLSTVVDCNALSDPANGQVSTSGTTFGETATYSCNTGYNLVGDSTRTCQATGNWSGSEPTCERMLLLSNMPIKYVHNIFLLSTVVDCNALSNPANGQVSTTGTTFGETATYSCNTGYNLVGDNTRTCQATGNWSGSEPTCERMLLLSNLPIKYVNNVFLLSTVVDCNALSDPANGQVSTTGGTTFGQTATYSCNTGYNLVGDNTRTCGATGNWSGSAPTCERMLLLSNMPIKSVHNVFLLSSVVDCNTPSDPADGQVSTTGTTFGETATYSCNPGYNLVGDNTRTCQATGNWSESEPTCQRMLLLEHSMT